MTLCTHYTILSHLFTCQDIICQDIIGPQFVQRDAAKQPFTHYLYAYNAKFFIKFNSPHISITNHLVIRCPSVAIMKGSTVVAADAK